MHLTFILMYKRHYCEQKPGTYLVKNHESQSRTIKSQFKKQWLLNWKCLGIILPGSYWIWRQTPKLFITVYWIEIVLLFKQHKWGDKNKYVSLNNSHVNSNRNLTRRIFYKDNFRSIDSSLHPMGRIHWIILRLWGFLCIRNAGCRYDKITVYMYM